MVHGDGGEASERLRGWDGRVWKRGKCSEVPQPSQRLLSFVFSLSLWLRLLKAGERESRLEKPWRVCVSLS